MLLFSFSVFNNIISAPVTCTASLSIGIICVSLLSFFFLIAAMNEHQKANNATYEAQYNKGCDNSRHVPMFLIRKNDCNKMMDTRDLSTRNCAWDKYEKGIACSPAEHRLRQSF